MTNPFIESAGQDVTIEISEVGPQGAQGPTGPTGPAGFVNVDGGSANSVFTDNQLIDGGTAGSF
jgi:hypothetical protein